MKYLISLFVLILMSYLIWVVWASDLNLTPWEKKNPSDLIVKISKTDPWKAALLAYYESAKTLDKEEELLNLIKVFSDKIVSYPDQVLTPKEMRKLDPVYQSGKLSGEYFECTIISHGNGNAWVILEKRNSSRYAHPQHSPYISIPFDIFKDFAKQIDILKENADQKHQIENEANNIKSVNTKDLITSVWHPISN